MLLVWHKLGKSDLTYSCMRSRNPCTCFVLSFGSSDLSCATGRLQCFMTVKSSWLHWANTAGYRGLVMLFLAFSNISMCLSKFWFVKWTTMYDFQMIQWLIVYTDSSQCDYLQVDCIVCDGNCSCKSSLELAGCKTQAVGDAKSNWWQSNWWDVCKIQHWKNVSILISLSLEC